MSDRVLVTASALDALVGGLVRSGVRVLAPRAADGRVEFAGVGSLAEVSFDHVQTVTSAKTPVFPTVERVLGYHGAGASIQLEDPEPKVHPTVLMGVRPCDARAFAALDAVFNWDSRDCFFDARMQAVTVVSIACTAADEACFCASVGGGPEDGQGSDLLLFPLTDGSFAADPLTEKGRALLAQLPQPPASSEVATEALRPVAEVAKVFDPVQLAVALDHGFDSPQWAEQALRCLGCGTCAYVCPTCACFDIQDEAAGDGGRRLRCWDSCGLRQFTLHASGHNPREQQHQRWRQRVRHKFLYVPERFGRAGCVGCGRCTRACPVDMNLKEHLVALAAEA